MRKLLIYFIASLLIIMMHSTVLSAAPVPVVSLFDWGFNVNGTTTCASALDGCDNTGTGSLSSNINTGSFNFGTGLGEIEVSISDAGNNSFQAFFDHDIDESINTFFNESGDSHNTASAGQSWEIDEPGFVFGDIFDNFETGSYDNSNNVPRGSEDDVSIGLGWDFFLNAGETANILLTLSLTEPGSGFYLSQTDADSNETLYFSSVLDIQATPAVVPVPAAVWLFGSGLILMFRMRQS